MSSFFWSDCCALAVPEARQNMIMTATRPVNAAPANLLLADLSVTQLLVNHLLLTLPLPRPMRSIIGIGHHGSIQRISKDTSRPEGNYFFLGC